MEITIKIDSRSKDSKTLIEYLRNLSFVEVLEDKKDNYDPAFVAKIRKIEKSKDWTTIKDPKNIWQDIL